MPHGLLTIWILHSWRTIRFQKDVPSENSSQQDQTESAAGSSTASSGPQSELSEVPLDNHGWGEDASLSIDWFGENSWDGYVGDDQSESMNMQELQTSLLEAGYAAAGSRNQHHYHHHHHHQRGHHRDTGSASGEAATSNRSSHSSLPCTNINFFLLLCVESLVHL